MRGLTNISIGSAFADVLKGKSKEELKKIFGEKVPDNSLLLRRQNVV